MFFPTKYHISTFTFTMYIHFPKLNYKNCWQVNAKEKINHQVWLTCTQYKLKQALIQQQHKNDIGG